LYIAIDEYITQCNNELWEDISLNIIDQQTNISENENLSSDILSVVSDPPDDESNEYIIWLYYNNLYSLFCLMQVIYEGYRGKTVVVHFFRF
jgi:hypothetical protein